MTHQASFARVAPVLGAALLIGTGGGFVLATILTLTSMLGVGTGPWWTGIAQAHGHLQLYGWAGLFVTGVALHVVPRLRGNPLAAPQLVPWILSALVSSLLLRALCQPLVATTGALAWRVGLLTSGVLESIALSGVAWLLAMTMKNGPAIAQRPAFRSVLPFIAGAWASLGLAGIVNLVNMALAATSAGIVSGTGAGLNVTLGLLGFLVPVALAMSAQALPMYAGLDAFPRKILWPLAGCYLAGLVLLCMGTLGKLEVATAPGMSGGLGMLLIGVVLLIFIGFFLSFMRRRGRLPQRVADLAPQPEALARSYKAQVATQRSTFGPFVALIASAYMWALLAGLLLLVDGLALLVSLTPPVALDAIRHSLAVGFITLLICGIAPRMITGFSGGKIVSPHLVSATLWLGNSAAFLRVGSILALPLLSTSGSGGLYLYRTLFGLSGPTGLALAACLAVNLWPALGMPGPGRPRLGTLH